MTAVTAEYCEFTVPSQRGGKLHAAKHVPGRTCKAALVFHHGYGEHIGRYKNEFMRLAGDFDIAVYAYDAFSFGRSELDPSKRGDTDNFEHFIDDLERFLILVQAELPATPTFLVGHSLGGLVATYTLLRDASRVKGLVLCSAAVDVKRNLVLQLLGPVSGVAAALVPRVRIAPAVDVHDLCNDPAVVAAYVADPLVFHGNVRARFAHLTKLHIEKLMPKYKEVTLPILAVHGTKDNIAPMAAVERLLREAGSSDKTMKPYEGAFHELVHGPEKTDVFNTIAEFVLSRL
mmetsp:Transcript_3652/g.7120  ORF Transcript_3652/g.7120 Transcript_3652/m.7120 type:complete len:289 (-) Transcript_3652:194-1060(-)